jgi:hypothetical protein
MTKKLESLEDSKIYHTSIEDCKDWFLTLNEELFDNMLPEVDIIDIRWRRKTWAYYQYIPGDNTAETKLCISKRYESEKFFVEILAHELIHHYQNIYNDGMDEVDHGESFMKWKTKFNNKGINLVESYEDEKQS